jgi:hypothetical protein
MQGPAVKKVRPGRTFEPGTARREMAMPLQMTPRVLGDVTIVDSSGRLVLGEEPANLRNLAKSVLAESKKMVIDLCGR